MRRGRRSPTTSQCSRCRSPDRQPPVFLQETIDESCCYFFVSEREFCLPKTRGSILGGTRGEAQELLRGTVRRLFATRAGVRRDEGKTHRRLGALHRDEGKGAAADQRRLHRGA